MKIPKSQLRKLIKEQVGRRIGVRSLHASAMQFIRSNGGHASDADLQAHLFDNNDIGDDDYLWELIDHVLESPQFLAMFKEYNASFSL